MEKSASQAIPPTQPRKRAVSAFAAIIVFAALALPPLHAQGCAQCLDTTAATSPKTQAAYRHAIILLTVTAAGLFATTLVLFKRHR